MHRFASLLLGLALALPAGAADAPAPYAAVTAERLAAPADGDWLMYRRTYDSWGYSPLDQITADNVAELEPLWTFSTGVDEGHQAPPIVNDGVMFISTPRNQVIAIDARSGNELWRYRRELPADLFQLHPTNRGVALYGERVYLATVDAHLVALDARTGAVDFDIEVDDYLRGYYMTLAPLAVEGKILVGMSGGEFGIRGYIQAFDAASGESLWKTYMVPGPGEPGFETWSEAAWKRGGVPVWVTGSYDPATRLSYWGTGNAGPWLADQRPGDNLYSTSVVALDIDSGAIRAHHQYHWNDSWDWDEVSAPLLIDFERNGEVVKGLVHAGRDGYLWRLARGANDIRFVDARPYVKQNVFTAIDPESGRPEYDPTRIPRTGTRTEFCPSIWGGKDWPPEAYSPQTGYLYVPANDNLCSALTGAKAKYRPGELFIGVTFDTLEVFPTEAARDHIGELQAWDMKTGEKVWTTDFKSHLWGPVLATGGGLVFAGGTNDRYFRAFDARSGKILWQQRTNSGVTGVPVSYSVDGRQYVAVLSGWGVDAQRKQDYLNKARGTDVRVPQGGVLWVFGLPDAP
ncbi:MAG: PQQ-dependent dehydrogenase, methanol/ethanol family [Gammaproteobacteria bacterium]|nr:PQQ-dependent dehydrogenase, methanol/ethanol family [Gammaproteobacteria bacterium]